MVGFILAGGKSTRMGQDKSLLKHNGMSFLEVASNLLSPHVSQIYLSSNGSGNNNDNYILTEDQIKDIGPLGGFHAYFSLNTYEDTLVIPIDLPLLQKEVIEIIIQKYTENPIITVAAIEGKLQPLVGVYNSSVKDTIENMIDLGDYKVRNIFSKIPHQIVDFDERFSQQFVNFNRPEDLEKLNI